MQDTRTEQKMGEKHFVRRGSCLEGCSVPLEICSQSCPATPKESFCDFLKSGSAAWLGMTTQAADFVQDYRSFKQERLSIEKN